MLLLICVVCEYVCYLLICVGSFVRMSLLPYNRSLLPYDRSLLPYDRSLLSLFVDLRWLFCSHVMITCMRACIHLSLHYLHLMHALHYLYAFVFAV